jgi:serine/threonine-protein kinase
VDAHDSGTRLDDRYLLVSQLATGATAVVWQAVDEYLNRTVAIKALHPHLAHEHDLAARFADEARVAATVSHGSLVAVYDTITGPPPAIVLEFVDGPDMRERLDAGPCSVAEVLGLGWSIADALDAVHRAGLVHRDVKPANIICTSGGRPKLGDFGIATASAGDRTATGVVLGTAKYLAPEQVRGDQIDARTDVYALCVVLYEALCGRVPFDRPGDLPTAMARLEESPPVPSSFRTGIPAGVEVIVLRGLARLPDARWPSAAALRDAIAAEAELLGLDLGPMDLHRVLSPNRSLATTAPESVEVPTQPLNLSSEKPTETPARRSRWRRRSVLVAGFLAVAVLGAALIAGGDPIAEIFDRLPSAPAEPTPTSAMAFDPEGTGPPGEHDELAGNVLDGDPTTEWHTEIYDDRMMGTKRGVGLVIELAEPARVGEVTITSDGRDWATSVYVSDTTPTELAQWGPALLVATGLDREVTLRPQTRGAALLIWITDLGTGGASFRLAIHEVTIS